jgi:hypothetical protein
MRSTLSTLAAAAALLSACAAHAPPATADPAAAATAIAATAPRQPLHVVFHWRALEGEARFSGEGVARTQAPYHARLDLFGPRGDTYLSAALVDADLRLPPGVTDAPIPPPALMWAVLGVVRPPTDATLIGTREQGDRLELWYDVEGTILRYVLEAGRLASARWDRAGRRLVVELRGQAPAGLPTQALYRDVVAVMELMLNLESVDEAEPFPPEIWYPGR